MPQKEIEVILTRQLASYLSIPVFIVDPMGTLIFYNEPAEALLGKRFEETGEMPIEEWGTIFQPTDDGGQPVQPEQLPLYVALTEQRPVHSDFWVRGLDGMKRHLEVTAFPLIGMEKRELGAISMFWEAQS